MNTEIKNDFTFILVISAFFYAIALLNPGGAGVIALGLPTALLFPGYAFTVAMFPAKTDLNTPERIILSFGLSMALLPLLGLVLNYTPWGIRPYPVLLALLALIAALSYFASCRRQKVPCEQRFLILLRVELSGLKKMSALDKTIMATIAVFIIVALVSMFYIVTRPLTVEKFTEFYILGPGGKAESYPGHIKPGVEEQVIVGIVNQEHVSATYTAEVRMNGYLKKSLGPRQLSHSQKWEEHVGLYVLEPHEKLKVEFLLYKDRERDPYRSLNLWVASYE